MATEQNIVERAIELAGGPTKAANACRTSSVSVWRWRELGYVPETKKARSLMRATGGKITMEQLAGPEDEAITVSPPTKRRRRPTRH